jgi:hypothetical protein
VSVGTLKIIMIQQISVSQGPDKKLFSDLLHLLKKVH